MRNAPGEPTDSPLVIPADRAPEPRQQPQGEVWKPSGTPGIEVNQAGQQRTNLPLPAAAPWFGVWV